jgi:hypothetical protein
MDARPLLGSPFGFGVHQLGLGPGRHLNGVVSRVYRL